jgi:periplasmic protein TonB
METNKILTADVLDVIFDNRNKKYGAYELRMNYNSRACKAMIFTFAFVFCLLSVPSIATLIGNDEPLPISTQFLDTEEVKPIMIDPIFQMPKNIITTTIGVSTFDADIATEIVTSEEVEKRDERDFAEDDTPSDKNHFGKPSSGITSIHNEGVGLGNNDSFANIPVVILTQKTDPEVDVFKTETPDVFPEFIGGEDEMLKFLQQNIQYPKRAIEANVEGKVTLAFVVNIDGEINNIEVVRSIGGGCDEEAVRVVRKMPKWKAGKFNGKNVQVSYYLPITFEFQK